MRHPIGLFLLVFVLATSTRARGDDAPEALVPKASIDAVRKAYADKDADLLAQLAARRQPDPWLLADGLCLQGAIDVALAFARMSKGPDTLRLPAYLETRRRKAFDKAVRDALEVGLTALDGDGSQHEAALARLETAVGSGDGLERALIANARAEILAAARRHGEAAGAFSEAGEHAERIGWLPLAAAAFRRGGHQARFNEDLEGMKSAWSRLITIQQARGDQRGTAKAIMLVGSVHADLGDLPRAAAMVTQAVSIWRGLNDPGGYAWVLGNLAEIQHRMGDMRSARLALEAGVEQAQRSGSKRKIAQMKRRLGMHHQTLRDHARALQHLGEAKLLFEELGDERDRAKCLGSIGAIRARQGAFAEGLASLNTALEIFRKHEDKKMARAALINLGWAHRKAGALDRARTYLEEALRLARESGDLWNHAYAALNLGDTLHDAKQYGDAERHHKEVLRLGAQMSSDRLLMLGHKGMARVWLAQGQFLRAVQEAERASSHSRALVIGLGQSDGAIAREQLTELYEVSIRAAARSQKAALLFRAIEDARVGALLESLENREAIQSAKVSEALLERHRRAKQDMALAVRDYQRAMQKGLRKEMIKRRKALESARAAVRYVIGQIQREAKAAAGLLYPDPATLEDLQEQLAADQTYVAYSLFAEPAVAMVVTKRAARIVTLEASDAIRAAATHELHKSDQDATSAIARMTSALVAPLKLPKDVRRVLISPDGVLGYVPFGLLLPDHQVTYCASATAYRVLGEEPADPGQDTLALGDPDYGIPMPAGAADTIPTRGGMRLVPLPATRQEAKAIGNVVLLGKDATRGGLLLALKTRARWRAVHLACHGRVDTEHPLESALALSFEKDGTNLLTCGDLFRWSIPADLVVLSACQTGKGRVFRVEGIVGLTQAFMLAGAPRVVVSLWDVDDAATGALMVRFYELWRGKDGKPGLAAPEALRQAQAYVRGQERWRHPFYWAAWVLWGLPE